MSAGFILQEQKMGMCCCRCGLHGLFSGLVRSCTLQPYNPSFCRVQFISECTIGVMLLGYVALTLRVLVCCMIIYYSVCLCSQTVCLKGDNTEVQYFPSNLSCELESSSFSLLLSMEIRRGSSCSWQAAPGYCFPGNIFLQCDYCMMGVKSRGTPRKRCDLEGGFIYWEDLEPVPACPLSMNIWEQAG